MGVQLNIKDARTVELARRHAERLGKSVTAALRELLEEEERRREEEVQRRITATNALVDRIRANLPEETKRMTSKEIMDSIYDDEQPDGFAL
jgi:hypothetical protein